jgi:hypothetical protein
MFYLAKILEAIGIAAVGLGLVLGINSPKLWIELYLSLIGVFVFGLGWAIEKYVGRRQQRAARSKQ